MTVKEVSIRGNHYRSRERSGHFARSHPTSPQSESIIPPAFNAFSCAIGPTASTAQLSPRAKGACGAVVAQRSRTSAGLDILRLNPRGRPPCTPPTNHPKAPKAPQGNNLLVWGVLKIVVPRTLRTEHVESPSRFPGSAFIAAARSPTFTAPWLRSGRLPAADASRSPPRNKKRAQRCYTCTYRHIHMCVDIDIFVHIESQPINQPTFT